MEMCTVKQKRNYISLVSNAEWEKKRIKTLKPLKTNSVTSNVAEQVNDSTKADVFLYRSENGIGVFGVIRGSERD